MRKLAWFVIIGLALALSVALTCHFVPEIGDGLYNVGVNVIGAGIVNGATGLMTGMMAWGATGLGPAVAIVTGWSLAAIIFWTVVLRKYIWNPIRGAGKAATSTVTLRGGPEPELPQSIEKTVPSEVKKEET